MTRRTTRRSPICATRADRWAERCCHPLVVRRLVLGAVDDRADCARDHRACPCCCSWRPRRRRCCPAGGGRCGLLWMVLLYLLLESVALVALFALWVASGFGWRIRSPRFQRAHYVIVQWFLQSAVLGVPAGAARARRRRRATTDVVRRPAAAHPVAARRPGRLVPRRARAGELVCPGAAHRAQGHAAVGPGDRRAAQPAAEPVHPTRARRQRRPRRAPGRRAVSQPRRERRLRHLPRGRQLHRAPAQAGDRAVAAQGSHRRAQSAPSSCAT